MHTHMHIIAPPQHKAHTGQGTVTASVVLLIPVTLLARTFCRKSAARRLGVDAVAPGAAPAVG